MRISCEKEIGVITLTATSEQESVIFKSILAITQVGEKLKYNGREGADCRSPYNQRMRIQFLYGNEILMVKAERDEDEQVVRLIRDAVYFGSGGLILFGQTEVDGKLALNFTLTRCKICQKPIVSMGECEWKICNACREKCEHTYVRGVVHGGKVDIGIGEFCEKCGLGKPLVEDEREKSIIEQHLAVENNLGIMVLYKDLPFNVGPQEIVQLKRVARGLTKSRVRTK